MKRDSPDIYALEVMNEILGGSGFNSRITRTVRSNEGLAYSAGSGIGFGVYYPGRFRAGFQSKSRSVPYATQLVLDEIRKIRETPVTRGGARHGQAQPDHDLPLELRLGGAEHGRSSPRTSTRSATPPSGRPTATASGP